MRKLGYAVVCAVLGVGCGGSNSEVAAKARASALAYVPAAQSCAARPGPASLVPSPIASVTSHVSGYRVCGPFKASTRSSSFDCPLRAGATGPFRLLVYNGRPDGTGRLSSAEILLNGKPVLREDAFSERTAAAAAPVALAATNAIAIRMEGDHGDEDESDEPHRAPPRELSVMVVDEGQACFAMRSAAVTPTSPLDRRFARINAFPISEFQLFPIVDRKHEELKKAQAALNGVALIGKHELRDETTAILKSITLGTSNRMTASVRRGAFTTQIVDRDETSPQFTIALPADGWFTNKPQLLLSGSVDDPSATVTVNGVAAVSASGSYNGQASLVECWNTITVAAADVCSNAGSAQVRVGLDTVLPVLAILNPPSGLITNQPAQPVVLRYSDNFSGIELGSLRVSLDGSDLRPSLTISADSATGSLTLPEGRHALHAQVSDRAGNLSMSDSSFIVDVTPPLLSIVAPKEGSISSQPAVAFAISYSDALSGVEVASFAAAVDGSDASRSFIVDAAAASATFLLATGPHTLTVQIADRAGNVSKAAVHVTVGDLTPPFWPAPKTLTASQAGSTSLVLTWSAAADDVAVTAYRVYENGALAATVGAATLSTSIDGLRPGSGYVLVVQAGDAAGNWSLDGPTLTYLAVPPDPALVAPPLDRTVATSFADSTAFLYSGANPIQQGVLPGAIHASQAAVLRGTVHMRDGAALAGVRVDVLNHPELGWTYSRADGAFDLAVNGGGPLTVECHRDGFLPVQRQLAPEWQNYSTVADVTMIPFDNLVSIVDLTQPNGAQLARGSLSTDGNGSRRATVLFPPGTQATLTLPDGTSRPLGVLHVRATEYTVGPQGAAAMPLDLPKNSAYTYAVSFQRRRGVGGGSRQD